ncbi:hypothetical protein OUZ56_005420 [Daphnia magna]|uniref:Uncharacterized protein n=1 Tax=Daphnia magna TaxID=35525 RepID=A0ABQ9YSR0_9CRUS|nr:hypothetical protein OUZ56_005420 [Daphnia magna]
MFNPTLLSYVISYVDLPDVQDRSPHEPVEGHGHFLKPSKIELNHHNGSIHGWIHHIQLSNRATLNRVRITVYRITVYRITLKPRGTISKYCENLELEPFFCQRNNKMNGLNWMLNQNFVAFRILACYDSTSKRSTILIHKPI